MRDEKIEATFDRIQSFYCFGDEVEWNYEW